MSHLKVLQRPLVLLGSLWSRVTRPVVPLPSPAETIEAQLLASMMLGGVLIGLCAVLLRALVSPDLLAWGLLNLGFVFAAYVSCRRGLHKLTLKVMIVLLSLTIYVGILSTEDPLVAVGSLYYPSVLVVLGSAFVSARFTLAVFVLQIIGLLLFPLFYPAASLERIVLGPLPFILLMVSLSLLIAFHRRQLEENRRRQLQESETRYRIISEISADYAFMSRVAPDGTVSPVWVTESFERVTGYARAEVFTSVPAHLLYHPEDWEQIVAQMEESRRTARPISGEYRLITSSGQERWVRLNRLPVWSEAEQRVTAFYGVVQDIHERKLTEIALKESEERYKAISDLISDYAFSYSVAPDGTPIHAWITEESFFRVTGFLLSEMQPDWRNLFHPDDWARMQADTARVIAGETISSDYRIITRQGEIRWLHYYRRPVWDARAKRVTKVYGVAQDITERRRAEIELSESEQHYRRMVEFSPDGTIVHRSGVIRFANMAGSQLLGTDQPEQLIGRSILEFVHPDFIAIAQERLERVQLDRQPVEFLEEKFVRLDGSLVDVEVAGVPILYQHEFCVHMVFRDITERKQAEEQQLQFKLEEERMRLIERFVSALSHDFRTSLSNIETSRYLIEKKLPEEARGSVLPHTVAINRSINRMAEQLANLHSIFSLAMINLLPTDLNRLIEGVIAAHHALAAQKAISVCFTPNDSLPVILADGAHLHSALKHLLANAINYTPDGGDVTVSVEAQEEQVRIIIHDSGIGIDQKHLPHIFDLFYRVDPARPLVTGGVGVGLSIARMVAEAHGGTLTAESVPNQGSTFILSMPLAVWVEA